MPPEPWPAGAAPRRPAWARGGAAVLYAAVGASMTVHAADATACTLVPRGVTPMPGPVQYAWPHPVLPLLYVAFSDRATGRHGVAAYSIDPEHGGLSAHGAPLPLAHRPIHLTLDATGRFLLLAYNMPSGVSVHALGGDGAIGAAAAVPAGVFAHQVRVAPGGRLVIVPTRGSDATATTPAAPGALAVFRFQDGQLTPSMSATEGDGLAFGPRHVDFHPSRPWMYVALERGNRLLTYALGADGISTAPLFATGTLPHHAGRQAPEQYAGAVQVHPAGGCVYVVNRSDATVPFQGQPVHAGGENSVARFAIDPASGEPRLVQSIPTRSFHCRTLSLHPEGRMLVAAAVAPLAQREGTRIRTVPAGLTVFAVAESGALRFVRKYDVAVGQDQLFWCGMLGL